MDSRKQFESEINKKFGDLIDQRICKNSDGDYMAWDMQVAWWAWQASRAAIELDIDWPEANDDTWKDGDEGLYARGHEDGKDKVVVAVRAAIRAAGLKVKGD